MVATSVSTPFSSTQLPSKEEKRPRARRFSTVDNDPTYRAIRAQQVAAQEAAAQRPPPTPARNGTAVDAEREILRREALALHESFLRGEMTEAVYERRRQDIGKQPDDLTRLESLEAL